MNFPELTVRSNQSYMIQLGQSSFKNYNGMKYKKTWLRDQSVHFSWHKPDIFKLNANMAWNTKSEKFI